MSFQNNTATHYSLISIILHWFMVIQIIAVYACILLRDLFPKESAAHEMLKSWHFMLGLSILVVVSLRLIARLLGSTPDIEPVPPKWQKLSAKFLHVSLYVLMVFMPLLGWTLLSAEGKPIPFFWTQLPAIIGENKDLADLIKEIHETGGTIGYLIIGLHAAAALFHHYIFRDNTLIRMLPGRH